MEVVIITDDNCPGLMPPPPDFQPATADEFTVRNFIDDIIDEELVPGGRCYGKTVHTRFPPEPNGYLHIGHAKAIAIDFGTALKYDGICNLRMDDTNPVREDIEYITSICEDVRWLGFDWEDRFYYASDYFERMYECAEHLVLNGLAFVCDQSAEEMRESRGTLTEPGTESPWRNRSIEENLDLFRRMRAGEFPDGARTLRAKIDMASGNMNMRDPVIYRIARATHHRTGNDWCIYPMYDFAHPLEDAFEAITHSLCSLEFEDHRPLYDWFIENCPVPHQPRQIEFARLNLTNTVMSKRKLRILVENGSVSGWDDPRLPTISGLRRRGFTPYSIRDFCNRIGVSKVNSTVDYRLLEHCLREDLNAHAQRVMAVLDPIELLITNYPADKTEILPAENNPEDADAGERDLSFSGRLWIERDDFMIKPIPKYFRLYPGNEVRLKHAYIIRCTGYETDDFGNVARVLAEYEPASRGGAAPDGRRIRGTIHWVDQNTAVDAEVRLYDNLFTVESPDNAPGAPEDYLNPDSLTVRTNAKLEASLAEPDYGKRYQFLRLGYFCHDNRDSCPDHIVFNRTVSLRDSFKLPTT